MSPYKELTPEHLLGRVLVFLTTEGGPRAWRVYEYQMCGKDGRDSYLNCRLENEPAVKFPGMSWRTVSSMIEEGAIIIE